MTNKTKNAIGEGVVYCVIVVVLALCGFGLYKMREEALKSYAETCNREHKAWVKLTGREDITLDEFVALRNAKALNYQAK